MQCRTFETDSLSLVEFRSSQVKVIRNCCRIGEKRSIRESQNRQWMRDRTHIFDIGFLFIYFPFLFPPCGAIKITSGNRDPCVPTHVYEYIIILCVCLYMCQNQK